LIVESATQIDSKVVDLMENYINSTINNEIMESAEYWPDSVIEMNDDIWVSDFPLEPLNSTDIMDNYEKEKEKFRTSKAYMWLKNILLEANDQWLLHGAIRQKLHTALKDDPAPYRRDVSNLVVNLLSYCKEFCKDEISITRPKHTEVIRLISKS